MAVNAPASIMPAMLAAMSKEGEACKRRGGGLAERSPRHQALQKHGASRRQAPHHHLEIGPRDQRVFRRGRIDPADGPVAPVGGEDRHGRERASARCASPDAP